MSRADSFTILDAVAVRAIASSTNASPIEVTTAAAHGLSTGDFVTIFGHQTNTAANGTWQIIVTAVNKFTLTSSTGNGVGGATGCFNKAPGVFNVADYSSVVLTFDTDGGGDAAGTLKVAGAIGDTPPDFAAAQAVDNRYEYLDIIDLEDGASIDGDTGFVVATADDHRSFEINVNSMDWITVIPVAGTAGEFTVKGKGYNPNVD